MGGAISEGDELALAWLHKLGGFTVDEFLRLPDLPPRTELIDGELVFSSPQRRWHAETVGLIERGLWQAVPSRLDVVRGMTVILDPGQAPEPDMAVILAEAVGDGDDMSYPGQVVMLVVEVVSPDSLHRDRERKPQLYAAAGIKHFWRVEEEAGRPVVYVYELDPATKTYTANGVHRDRLKLSVPYDIDIELPGLDRPGTPG